MKEIYISPELELQKLIPEKKLALIEDDGVRDESKTSDGDIELPL